MSVQDNKGDQSGRQAPQRGQRTLFWCILILVIICAVLLIAGVCAGAFMFGWINSQAEKNKEDLLQNIQNVVEMNNFTAEKKKADLLLSLQNIVGWINSQAEKNKEDLLQNIQNVVEMNNFTAEKEKRDLLLSLQNIVGWINSQAEKNKEDLLQNILILEERINIQLECSHADLLQNIQNVGISSWKRFGNKLYYFSTNYVTWEEARGNCVSMGTNLAMTKTKEELQFLAKQGEGKYWLGLNDIASEGTWKWLDGSSPAAGLWDSGEPNNQYGHEDCGETFGELNDVPCDLKRRWICEKSLV